MAIAQDEMNSIVSAVLSAIRTNSRTIDQLTPVTSLSDNDSFEINGGKRVTYKVLSTLIASLSSSELDAIKVLIDKFKRESDLKLNDIKSDLLTQSEWKDSHELQYRALRSQLESQGMEHAARLNALESLTVETIERVTAVEDGVERNGTDIRELSKATLEQFTQLQDSVEALTNYCDSLSRSLSEYQSQDYKGVRQLALVSKDPDCRVAVEFVDEPVTMGGVVEYYEPGYFVLKATDGKRYDRWSNRWWFYNASGGVRTDVLFLYDNRLWQWTGTTLVELFGEAHSQTGSCDCEHEEITNQEINDLLGGCAPDITPGSDTNGGNCNCEHEEITEDEINSLVS